MRHKKRFSFKTVFATALLVSWVGIVSAQDQDKWTGHIEFFAKPGSDRSIAKGDLFLPLDQDEDFLLFGNLKANFDDHSYKEGNVGMGARRLYDEWIVGGWVFYDWKESSTSNTFDQLTIGGELLSTDWDIRANAYIAENKRKDSDNASVIEVNGSQIQARLGEERALPGVDFEVGRKLPFLEDSRFFLGAYQYDASDFEKVSGPRVRLEMRFHDLPLISSISKGSRLTLGAEYTEDSVRGSETFALLQLRIPFGGKSRGKKSSLTELERRMTETVVRDDDIITSKAAGDKMMSVLNPKTGQVISNVQTIDASTVNVSGTVASAGQNSLIIADGAQGNISVGGSTINTQAGQIIAGGGQQIALQAMKPNGGVIDMTYTPTGQRPNISRTGSGELIYVNNDDGVIVNGVDLAGGRPIRIRNSQNVCVVDTNVLNSAANRQGIYMHNNSSADFQNVNISNTGRQGVLLQSSSTANFNNLTISNTGREGVYLTSNSSAVINNLAITNTGREGLELANSSAVLSNININNTTHEGMRIRNGSDLTANYVNITKTGSEAIELNNSILNLSNASILDIDVNANRDGIYATNNATLNLNNVVIDNVTSQGIITTNNTTSTINNVSIQNTGHQGLYLSNSTTTDINSLDISNVGRQGIYLNNSNATINDATIRNSAREGLYVRDSDLNLSNTSISDITASANRDGIFVYRDSNVSMNNVSVSNVTGDGMQVHGTAALNPTVVATDLNISNAGRFGIVTTRGDLTLNNAIIYSTVFDGILVNRGDLTINTAAVSNSGRFGVYALRSNAVIQDLTVSNTARDGVLVNRSDLSMDNSTIRDIGDGDTSDDALQVINSNLSGTGNRIEGVINNGVACRRSGTNTGSIGFSFGPIISCP